MRPWPWLLVLLTAPPLAAQPLFDDVSTTNLPPSTSVSQSSMDVEAADLDGDGDLDLVIAGEFQLNTILLNNGDGLFTDGSDGLPPLDPSEVPPPLPPAHDTEDIAVEDFDGDGHLDIVFVSEDDDVFGRTNVHEYYRGHGDGTFTRIFGILPDTEANAVEAADLTGDGGLDLVLNGGGQDRLLVGDGTGGVADETAARLPSESDVGQDVEAVDVDGDLDLVRVNLGPLEILLNDGTGVFTDATDTVLPAPISGTGVGVEPTDLNADGAVDLYVALLAGPQYNPDGFDRLLLRRSVLPSTEDRGEARPRPRLEPLAPNPSGTHAEATFILPEPEHVRLALVDARGREVAVIAEKAYAAGLHTVTLDLRAQAPGAYVVVLTAGLVRTVQPFVRAGR